MDFSTNIILTGFMGTGKTEVARLVAQRLGLRFLDTDSEIEQRAGISISEIFQRVGEQHFRNLEKEICSEFAELRQTVVATGGGMPVDPDNRKRLCAAGTVICLKASVGEVLSRIGSVGSRPLLDDADPVGEASKLLKEREAAYSAIPFQLDTTGKTVERVAEEVLRVVKSREGETRFLSVSTPGGGGYTITLGDEVLERIGALLRDRGLTSKVAVVTDSNVAGLYLERVMASLGREGFKPFSCVFPAGEESKTLSQLEKLYRSFVAGGLDRRGSVVALGGGVTGDLAGFAAATYMRGVGLVQCPTTLLAMVDSCVGGKTGVDLIEGKNLVGAFKQPIQVAADVQTLQTLPQLQVSAGMAELIKHAVIDDPILFDSLESSDGPPLLSSELVSRSMAVKIRVVEEDPDESGIRAVLNLGHTVGHALEKCSGYVTSHGEAVSVGLAAAARISEGIGLCGSHVPERVEALLEKTGLPINHEMDSSELMRTMASDKKAVEGRVPFVLIRDIGVVEHGCHVPPAIVLDVLEYLRRK